MVVAFTLDKSVCLRFMWDVVHALAVCLTVLHTYIALAPSVISTIITTTYFIIYRKGKELFKQKNMKLKAKQQIEDVLCNVRSVTSYGMCNSYYLYSDIFHHCFTSWERYTFFSNVILHLSNSLTHYNVNKCPDILNNKIISEYLLIPNGISHNFGLSCTPGRYEEAWSYV